MVEVCHMNIKLQKIKRKKLDCLPVFEVCYQPKGVATPGGTPPQLQPPQPPQQLKQPPQPPQPPQQLKQPPQPPQPPQQLKQPPQPPQPPHAHAWWVATAGPRTNSNTAPDIVIMLNTALIFVFIVI